ncbi:unnamed protein product [Chironomus riparius]|uniref:Uncharacterized protein n=1 Tax=Chironomus riparius TaxID=315576 RepID=A0A9N9RJL9_9DIPT|nr:unnamed protein product [Chironomus riparius]
MTSILKLDFDEAFRDLRELLHSFKSITWQSYSPSGFSNSPVPILTINIPQDPNWHKKEDEEFNQIDADRN